MSVDPMMAPVEDYNFPFKVHDYTERIIENWDEKAKAVYATNYCLEEGQLIPDSYVTEIDLSVLSAGQPTVKPEVIDFYCDEPTGLYDDEQKGNPDLPVVVFTEGEYIVTNGNHRIVAGLVRGEGKATVLLVPSAPMWDPVIEKNARYKLACWKQGIDT